MTGVTQINGRGPADWLQAPLGATAANLLPVFASRTSTRATGISVDTSNNITGVASINTKAPADLVTGPASATANTIPRFGDTGGKTLVASTVAIDGSGNLTGVGTINGMTPSGDFVKGPASTNNMHIPRFSDTSGKIIGTTGAYIDNSNNIITPGSGVFDQGVVVHDTEDVTYLNRLFNRFHAGKTSLVRSGAYDSSPNTISDISYSMMGNEYTKVVTLELPHIQWSTPGGVSPASTDSVYFKSTTTWLKPKSHTIQPIILEMEGAAVLGSCTITNDGDYLWVIIQPDTLTPSGTVFFTDKAYRVPPITLTYMAW